MKQILIRAACAALVLIAGTSLARAAFDPVNDDTDLFLANPAYAVQRPNVLIFLDNTANWNSRFENEKIALASFFNGLDDNYNVGLMMYTETGTGNSGPDGGYVRAAVRQMTPTNRALMAGLISSFDKNGDKGNNATVSLAMHEIYAYFAGTTARSGIKKKRDHTGNAIPGLFVEILLLLPFTLGLVLWLHYTHQAVFLNLDWSTDLLLILGGPITILPLAFFTAGTRMLPMTTVAFPQNQTSQASDAAPRGQEQVPHASRADLLPDRRHT